MRAVRVSLVCSGITLSMRKQGFPTDDPIEKRSADLATRLAVSLAEADLAYAGPSIRARETATLLRVRPQVTESLRDQDYGVWAGGTLSELQERDPKSIAAWLSDPTFVPPGGESIADVAKRAFAFLDEVRQSAGHVIAVTHAAVIRTAILDLLGAPLTAFWRIDAPPLSVTDLRYDGRRWVLRAHGLTCGREN